MTHVHNAIFRNIERILNVMEHDICVCVLNFKIDFSLYFAILPVSMRQRA